jgi:hypothetical protein
MKTLDSQGREKLVIPLPTGAATEQSLADQTKEISEVMSSIHRELCAIRHILSEGFRIRLTKKEIEQLVKSQ